MLWAWQIGLVGSVVFFLGALLLLIERPAGAGTERRVVALLIGALLCSGIGVMAVAGVAAAHALRRRSLLAGARLAAVPALAFAAWFLAYGRGGVRSDLSSSLPLVPEFILTALSAGLAGLAGLPASGVGPALAVAFTLGCAAAVVRHGEPPVAAVASVVACRFPRLLSSAASRRAGGVGGCCRPVRARVRRPPAAHRAPADLHCHVAAEDGMLREQAIRSRVELGAALLAGGADSVSTAQPHSPGAPALTVQGLRALVAQDAVSFRSLEEASPVEVAEALTAIQVDVKPSSGAPFASPLDLTLEPSPSGELGADQPGCRTVSSPGGAHPVYSYRAAGIFSLSAGAEQSLRIYHGEIRDFAPLSFRDAKLAPGQGAEVRLASPRTGVDFLRLDIAPGASVTLCSA